LQAGDFRNIQALENEVDSGPITIKYLNGTYKVPGRELDANFKITNNGKEPLRIGGGQGLVAER
jgi:methane/ammonia monooxygenase subunit B